MAFACSLTEVVGVAALGVVAGPLALRWAARLARTPVPYVPWPLASAAAASYFAVLACVRGVSLETLALMGFACVLATLALVDVAERRIPNACIAYGCVLRAAALVAEVLAGRAHVGEACAQALTGAAVTCAPAVLLALATCAVRGEAGVGGGDLKLLATVGLYTGWWYGLLTLFAACVLGVAGTLPKLCRGLREHAGARPATFAFGPPLALSCAFWVLFSKKPFI